MKTSTIAEIFGISLLSLAVASFVMGGFLGGAAGILGGPILLILAWPYIPVVIALHFLAWASGRLFRSSRFPRLYFTLSGVAFAAVLFALIGPKEDGHLLAYSIAYAVAAGFGALVSCLSMCLSARTWPDVLSEHGVPAKSRGRSR